jgi:hypothetical protein
MPQSRQNRPRRRDWASAWHQFWLNAWHHIVKEFPAALFVASVITIVDYKTYLIESIDVFAFVVVANDDVQGKLVTAEQRADRTAKTRARQATVVTIDESAYSKDYKELSPLSRCPLLRDLERIYASNPRLVVIDLDISPAYWLDNPAGKDWLVSTERQMTPECQTGRESAPECQVLCQRLLYQNIKDSKAETVLMLPFGVPDFKTGLLDARYGLWMESMQSSHVRFGDAQLEPELGLFVLDVPTVEDSIARQACRAAKPGNDTCAEKRHGGAHTINPRMLLDGTIGSMTTSEFAKDDGGRHQVEKSAVFFGGNWDDTDHYVTPAGRVNGVEVHAVAYTSLGKHAEESKPLHFGLDLALAVFFGFPTAWLWGQYFDCRFGNDLRSRVQGPIFVILLPAAFIVIVAVAFKLSYLLLHEYLIWASPVPIAIGRFIEGFVTCAVAQAVHAALGRAHQGSVEASGLHGGMQDSLFEIAGLWNKVDAVDNRSDRSELPLLVKPECTSAHVKRPAPAPGSGKYRAAAIWLALIRTGCFLTVLAGLLIVLFT